MALKRLPADVRDLFCASTRINTFKRAVEELVYNALDAKSTCIAIRVNIQESTLQVIDNGQGILQSDMDLLGYKNTTSKLTDLANLKAPPHTYGFKGQSLSFMVEVSEKVTITSKSISSSNTLEKTFSRGKFKGGAVNATSRPSKGTTVEIKGFLYNLSIQRKAINPVNELQSIKYFLQRLALVHNNISISLRDDTVNEIIFKIHRCKDIYQTLKTMFDLQENKIKELKVEKHKYKVIAYITKTAVETVQYNWIYLNGRFMNKCILHKIVEDSFKKLPEYKHSRRVGNKQRTVDDNYEETLFKKNFPSYFMFIICPYNEYSSSDLGNEIVVQFKKQDSISDLLQKLIKFYGGDVEIQEVIKQDTKTCDYDTRDKVKEIMNNIQRNTKKVKISQMHNGVKGKVMKRKLTKNKEENAVSSILPHKNMQAMADKMDRDNLNDLITIKQSDKKCNEKLPHVIEKAKSISIGKIGEEKKKIKMKPKDKKDEAYKKNLMSTKSNIVANSFKVRTNAKHDKTKNKIKQKVTLLKNSRNKSLVKTFNDNNDIVKRRCNIIKAKADHRIMNFKIKNNPNLTTKYQFEAAMVTFKNKSISFNNKVSHVIVPKNKNISENQYINANKLIPVQPNNKIKQRTHNILCRSTYDLLQTVLKSQTICNTIHTHIRASNTKLPYSKIQSPHAVRGTLETNMESQDIFFTYDSHQNGKKYSMSKIKNFTEIKKHFISKHSEDNFKLHDNKGYYNLKKGEKKQIRKNLSKYQLEESSYTIQFSSNARLMERNSGQISNFYNYTVDRNEISNHCNATMNEVIDNTYNTYTIRKTTYFLEDNCRISQNKDIHNVMNNTNMMQMIRTSQNENDKLKSTIQHNNIQDHKKPKDIENYSGSTLRHKHISETQYQLSPVAADEAFNPITLCETILNEVEEDIQNKENETKTQRELENMELTNITDPQTIREDISHYFDRTIESILRSAVFTEGLKNEIETDNAKINTEIKTNLDEQFNSNNNFEFKNRPRYIPKGMSPIFKNCNTKVVCNYNHEEEYFKDDIYEDFIRDVETNTDVFEAHIESIKDFMSREIRKFNNKVKKDNADLSFDGNSLKNAKVIGQIDRKFIAATMKCKSDFQQYLIMFDQHAVHERIKLETYLSDYFVGRQWKSIKLDFLRIKMDRDVIIYLHNYKEQFEQLGLKWNFSPNEDINVFEIPEAIIGKNIRQVDVIMKSVRNLIYEEIEIIKAQRGSISLYPKSIMDLVFSEACRYAIKFGDKLTHSDCTKLIEDLSKCNTPFQCAHGRPVMAVLIEIGINCNFYKINKESLKQFKTNIINKVNYLI